jgi:hypothetical protein
MHLTPRSRAHFENLLSQSRNSPNFMKSEGSLADSQKLTTSPILSHIDPVHVDPADCGMIHCNIPSHLHQGTPRGLFTSGLPTKTTYALCHLPLRATSPAHLIHLPHSAVHQSQNSVASQVTASDLTV